MEQTRGTITSSKSKILETVQQHMRNPGARKRDQEIQSFGYTKLKRNAKSKGRRIDHLLESRKHYRCGDLELETREWDLRL